MFVATLLVCQRRNRWLFAPPQFEKCLRCHCGRQALAQSPLAPPDEFFDPTAKPYEDNSARNTIRFRLATINRLEL